MLRRLAVLVVALGLCTLTAFANNQVYDIDVTAVINQDGSMDITQQWTGKFTEGTENYIPMVLSGDMELTDLQVFRNGEKYETVDEWDVDWSFEEKTNRCGINRAGGAFELCYGISSYGTQTYVLQYRLSNVITAFSDYDAMNFRFVNDQMNTTPTGATVDISLADGTPITDEIADIWGFGFDGTVNFVDGTVEAVTDDDLSSRNHVTVMLALDKGILSPQRTDVDSFDTMKDRAMAGSDYDNEDDKLDLTTMLIVLFSVISSLFPFILTFGIMISRSRKKKKRRRAIKNFAKDVPYYREIPNGGNLEATYALGRMYDACEEGAILGTRMLRLIDDGNLAPITETDVGFFGGVKEIISLRLEGYQPHVIEELNAQLYDILEKAAGMDGILQNKELEVFLKKNDRVLRRFINNCDSTGRNFLREQNVFRGKVSSTGDIENLTEAGREQLCQLLGFKRYLEDFTLISERGVKEIPLWKDLLSYAMLFGLAEKLAEQLEDLYPEIAPEVEIYTQQLYTAHAYHYMLYRGMRRSEQQREAKRAQAARSSGSGGRSSFGGGGGFSGGGSGGGSR